MSQHVLFSAGGLDLAVPAEAVKAIHEDLAIQPVAGTKAWFLGLTVAHGKLLPVTDMGAFCANRSSTGRTLELDPGVAISGLRVDVIYGLSDTHRVVSSESLFSNKPNLMLSAYAIEQDQRVHRVLDLAALVQMPEFLDIADVSS